MREKFKLILYFFRRSVSGSTMSINVNLYRANVFLIRFVKSKKFRIRTEYELGQ